MHRWVYFDTDDTLVMWDLAKYPNLESLIVTDPYDGKKVHLKVHAKHLKLLKQLHSHGETIVIWSAAGAEWAKAVCNALGILNLVSHFLQKPDTLYDDESPKIWMPMTPRWKLP